MLYKTISIVRLSLLSLLETLKILEILKQFITKNSKIAVMNSSKSTLMPYLTTFRVLLIVFTSFPIFLSAQSNAGRDLNAEYFDSLPESVKMQLASSAGTNKLEDAVYNQDPDTRMDTMKAAISALKEQLDSLESMADDSSDEGNDRITVFGSNFFSSYQTSFAPINEQNIASDYVVGVGDILSISLFGNDLSSKQMNLKVARDGSILIENFGPLTVAGLSFDQIPDAVESFVSMKKPGTSSYVAFQALRDIQVMLVGGQAKNGIYTLPGGSTVLTLLHAVGGPGKYRSFRKILHKRNSRVVEEIDLYSILIFGNFNFKNRLQSGDTVVLQPVSKRVGASGGVGVQAIYELKEDENLEDLITFARGLKKPKPEYLTILSKDSQSTAIKTEDDFNHNLKNGDLVTVPFLEAIVRDDFKIKISGAIKNPGIYSSAEPITLSELVSLAGGYTKSAYPFGAKLLRSSVAKIQQEAADRSYNEIIAFLASSGSSPSSMGIAASPNLEFVLAQIKNIKPTGRVTADFSVNSQNFVDTILVSGDELYIPYFSSEVSVLGEVQNSGIIPYKSGLKANDYIEFSGGYSRFADKGRVVVINPDGLAYQLKAQYLFSDSIEIYPGSIIYIPRDIGKVEGISFAATVAPIFSSLALSLASLNTIK